MDKKKKVFPIRILIERLHLFADETDTYVAFSQADADQCFFEFVGETRVEIDCQEPLLQIKDSQMVSVCGDDDFIKHRPLFSSYETRCLTEFVEDDCKYIVTAPAWAWALHNGRGFLCSTEY